MRSWSTGGGRPAAKRRVEIARIEERNAPGAVPALMAAVGGAVMLVLLVVESSAIRLAAWGAIWTGWNVLALMISEARRRSYVVTREAEPDG